MPWGQACLRPALEDKRDVSVNWSNNLIQSTSFAGTTLVQTYNSASKCCRFTAGRLLIFAAAGEDMRIVKQV
jgi:hypothetical protein